MSDRYLWSPWLRVERHSIAAYDPIFNALGIEDGQEFFQASNMLPVPTLIGLQGIEA
ncbi:MAG TPA: hypothetical protein VIX89_01910 [Bryobacteraceae bacterium]